jgi:hypothetical protein
MAQQNQNQGGQGKQSGQGSGGKVRAERARAGSPRGRRTILATSQMTGRKPRKPVRRADGRSYR